MADRKFTHLFDYVACALAVEGHPRLCIHDLRDARVKRYSTQHSTSDVTVSHYAEETVIAIDNESDLFAIFTDDRDSLVDSG
jgi:hypothetical protein